MPKLEVLKRNKTNIFFLQTKSNMQIINSNLPWFLFVVLFFAISCTSTQTPSPNISTFDKEKILVFLKKGISSKSLETEFSSFELLSKGQTSRSENRFIFTFNTNLIASDELLEKIKNSDLVIEAAFPEVLKEPRVN